MMQVDFIQGAAAASEMANQYARCFQCANVLLDRALPHAAFMRDHLDRGVTLPLVIGIVTQGQQDQFPS
jgi:hypothetical protein